VKRAKNTTCDKHPLKAGTNTNNINTIKPSIGVTANEKKENLCIKKCIRIRAERNIEPKRQQL